MGVEEIKEEMSLKDEAIEKLKKQLDQFDELNAENNKNSEILARLFERGIIDAEGELNSMKIHNESTD